MTVLLKEDGDKLLKEDGYAIRVEPYFILVDAGAGVDALANRGLALFEVGVGEELAPVFTYRDLFKSDTGLGTDLATLLAGLVRADTGTGIDIIIAFLTVSEKFGVDSGTGVDISALKAYFMPLPDAGVGIDNIISRALGRPDIGIGTDVLVSLLAELVKSDAAIGDIPCNITDTGDEMLFDFSDVVLTSVQEAALIKLMTGKPLLRGKLARFVGKGLHIEES